MKEITSTQNSIIKETKKLLKNKYRIQTGKYMIEGEHLVEEAINEGQVLSYVFMTDKFIESKDLSKIEEFSSELYLVSESVIKSISTLPTPQGIVAVLDQQKMELPEALEKPLLLLDNVQDPGNVGTMIRTADAAGYGGVVLGQGCADIYNNKVQRSLQGSHFHLPIIQEDLATFIPILKEKGIAVYGTALDERAVDYRQLSVESNFAVILGNEGQGVSDNLLNLADATIYIPMPGNAESLNVAVAAGIIMFQLLG